jgi:hypothetical protein
LGVTDPILAKSTQESPRHGTNAYVYIWLLKKKIISQKFVKGTKKENHFLGKWFESGFQL